GFVSHPLSQPTGRSRLQSVTARSLAGNARITFLQPLILDGSRLTDFNCSGTLPRLNGIFYWPQRQPALNTAYSSVTECLQTPLNASESTSRARAITLVRSSSPPCSSTQPRKTNSRSWR